MTGHVATARTVRKRLESPKSVPTQDGPPDVESDGRHDRRSLGPDGSLHLAERRLVTILETIAHSFRVLDRQRNFVYANRQAASLLGTTPGKLLGKNIWDEYPALVGSTTEDHYRKAVAGQVPTRLEVQSSYSGRWYLVDAHPSPEGLAVYGQDITREKESEAERAKLREDIEAERVRLATVVQNMPVGVFLADDSSSAMTRWAASWDTSSSPQTTSPATPRTGASTKTGGPTSRANGRSHVP